MKTKICARCKKEKRLTFFGVNRKQKDGHNIYCCDCIQKEYKNKAEREKEQAIFNHIDQELLAENLKGLKELVKHIKKEKDIYPFWFSYKNEVYQKNKKLMGIS